MGAEARLVELKLELPPAPKPVATYVTAVQHGDLIYVSGHGPLRSDGTLITGKLGADMDVAAGQAAARQTGLAILSTLASTSGLSRQDRAPDQESGHGEFHARFSRASEGDKRLFGFDERRIRGCRRRDPKRGRDGRPAGGNRRGDRGDFSGQAGVDLARVCLPIDRESRAWHALAGSRAEPV